MMCPIGWASGLKLTPDNCSRYQKETFQWDAYYLERLQLSHPIHLMIIEGVAPTWFFVNCSISSPDDPKGALKGPFFLLRGDIPHLSTVPYVLGNVVLGKPLETPKGAKMLELAGSMVETLLSTPKL